MKSWLAAFIIFICFLDIQVLAQNALPQQPSPNAITTITHNDTYVKITYSRPHKRGRTVFGGMIPYEKIWRTGANEATEITLTRDIRFGPKLLKQGTYSIFSIPYEEKWVIIVNSELDLWGAYEYNPEKDIMRFEVPVVFSEIVYEPFTIEFEQTDKITNLVMRWDQTKVAIPVHFF